MKKLSTFLVFGAVLATGLQGQAMAADVASVYCSASTTMQFLGFSQASAGVTLPPSRAAASTSSCTQCLADLLTNGFKLANSFNLVGFFTGTTYFVLKRGGRED